ncbi:hypothetical protein AC578_6711 [Pseudocercospora eumusae]|uniref:Glutamate--cysteine ligase n=1 Tax=Pseudocercospora eumusae TaxID=321146 RepID=A0A139GTH9_9PEZI|nr:hypothetical protein AC578_6711 [Pseudocercospora eumusae]
MATSSVSQDPSPFRLFLKSDSPFLKDIEKHTAISHADDAVERVPQITKLVASWQKSIEEPLKGVSHDGTITPHIFELADDGIDMEAIVKAAGRSSETLTQEQRRQTMLQFDAKEKRMWQNTHFYVPMSRFGIRLDQVNETKPIFLRHWQMTKNYSNRVVVCLIWRKVRSAWLAPTFHPEFGRFMLEATPGKPWSINFKDLLDVETDMKWRRKIAKDHIYNCEYPITLTTFLLLRDRKSITPYYPPSRSKLRSQFVPNEIANPHIRFLTLATNIR